MDGHHPAFWFPMKHRDCHEASHCRLSHCVDAGNHKDLNPLLFRLILLTYHYSRIEPRPTPSEKQTADNSKCNFHPTATDIDLTHGSPSPPENNGYIQFFIICLIYRSVFRYFSNDLKEQRNMIACT